VVSYNDLNKSRAAERFFNLKMMKVVRFGDLVILERTMER